MRDFLPLFFKIRSQKGRNRNRLACGRSLLNETCVLSGQCSHQFAACIGGRLECWQRAHPFANKTPLSEKRFTFCTTAQMYLQCSCIHLSVFQFTICGEHCPRLTTVHSSPTSFWYNPMNRSLALIKRILTADALMLSTPAISAQESPSFS